MDTAIENELAAVIEKLSPRDKWLVVGYARSLQASPDLSEAGQAYLDMLKASGASGADLARAAQAVQAVEQRYAELGTEAAIRDLEYRTEAHMRAWLRERGLDYDTLTEDQLYDLTNELIQRHRQQS